MFYSELAKKSYQVGLTHLCFRHQDFGDYVKKCKK